MSETRKSLAKHFGVSLQTMLKMLDRLLTDEEREKYVSVQAQGLRMKFVYADEVREILTERLNEMKQGLKNRITDGRG